MRKIIGLLGIFIFGLGLLAVAGVIVMAPKGAPNPFGALVSGVIMFALSVYLFRSKSDPAVLDADRHESKELSRKLWREHSLTVTGLSVVLIAVYAVLYSVGRTSFIPTAAELYDAGAGFGESAAHGEAWRLFTQIFLHANIGHLISNIAGLWAAGRLLEFVAGRKNLISVFLAGGLLASVTSALVNPSVVSVGASGAIFALYGALFSSYFFNSKMQALKIPKSVWWFTGYQAVNSIWYGFQNVGVDNAAHVGGLIAGFMVMTIWYKLTARNSEKASKVFAGAAGFAFVFAIAVMPALVKKSQPQNLSQRQDAVNEAMDSVRRVELELLDGVKRLKPGAGQEYLSWLHNTIFPKYEKVIKELREIPTEGLDPKLVLMKDLVGESATICYLTYRQISGLDRTPASTPGPAADKIANDCQRALNERAAYAKTLSGK